MSLLFVATPLSGLPAWRQVKGSRRPRERVSQTQLASAACEARRRQGHFWSAWKKWVFQRLLFLICLYFRSLLWLKLFPLKTRIYRRHLMIVIADCWLGYTNFMTLATELQTILRSLHWGNCRLQLSPMQIYTYDYTAKDTSRYEAWFPHVNCIPCRIRRRFIRKEDHFVKTGRFKQIWSAPNF